MKSSFCLIKQKLQDMKKRIDENVYKEYSLHKVIDYVND